MHKALMLAAAALLAMVMTARPEMNTEQTLSDQAQAMTIAFDGLAFLTGSVGADSFLPPGKVADLSGFQYLRDNDPTELGHNTEFVTIIARNVLGILSAAQITQMVQRAESQAALIQAYGYARFPLMEAFRRNLTNNLPAGSQGLDWAAVTQASADLYVIDGQISLDRAQLFGDILRSLTPEQKSTLDALTALHGIGYWPAVTNDPLQSLHLTPEISVGVMTYASEMYSWYAGNVAADVYFCPERQGTYFGSFYLKDTPAMNSTNYTIDPNLTADMGDAFLAALTPAQQALVTNLVTVQKPYLYDIVTTRSNIALQLRQLMTTNSIDTNAVLALFHHYGDLDGMIVYFYATHFAQVGQSLSAGQQAALMAMRVEQLTTNLLYPSGAYLYSAPVAMPVITNSAALLTYSATNRLPVADTGQTNSYTTVFGEDADYTIRAPAFTNAGGIAFDTISGRMWQQADGGEMTWEAAAAYADALSLGGYTDWRLPTAHELFGTLNHARLNPALDTNVFTAGAAEYWWSQDQQADNTTNVWAANAGGGIGPHPRTETLSAGGSKRFHVRCVRGAAPPGAYESRHHFLNNADGTITDLDTGLTWQQADAAAVSWTNALRYAESLSLAGHTDWRLPNIRELHSLNDETRAAPSLDPTWFPTAASTQYWSSTTLAGDAARAWTVDFAHGIASYADKVLTQRVRCVRGGGTNVAVAAGAAPVRLASGLGFTEGPAADASGQIYFSAVTAGIIYRWSLEGALSVFRTNAGNANGLSFNATGSLVACEGGNGRITATGIAATNVTVLSATYNGLRYNEPNDLWIAPDGGVYFTDPVYFGHAVVQGGEHVYYLAPGATGAVRVASDLVRPNGLAGTPDGQTLYIADWGASNVYRYAVQPDGTLTGKSAFAAVRCDGMTIDSAGRLYFCETAVRVFDAGGKEVERISIAERPTNVEFGGDQRQFLFITTDAGSLYAVRMSAQGLFAAVYTNPPPAITLRACWPVAPRTSDVVWVTASVTDNTAVAAVSLAYGDGALGLRTNAALLETMRTVDLKPWSGDGCDNPWSVAWVGTNPFEQRAGANFGAGNACGLEFKLGTTNLADSMITLGRALDVRGIAASVELQLWAGGLTNDMGWTLQLDAGSGFTTRLGELTGVSHGWQLYHYDLQPAELVSNLLLRFQFRGGSGDPRVDVDRISVMVVSTGVVATVPMYDDGLHQDGAAGDGVYGASLPARATAADVSYYITAWDSEGATARSPSGAPSVAWGYHAYSASADSVGDGIPDWWRARHFGGNGASTNASSCAIADPDNDGVNNLGEYLADTLPTNAVSRLAFTGITMQGDGVRLTWTGGSESSQVLECRTNLADGAGAWVPLRTNLPPTALSNEMLHQSGVTAPVIFYRLQALR
jgi:sugar lactone lactonase YvrE